MDIVIAGPDAAGLGTALESKTTSVTRVSGLANRTALESAGIDTADLFVLTDVDQATAIPVARDINRSVRVVVYGEGKLPEFARPMADFIIDPNAIAPDVLADELT